jgi:hypothetical protein
MYYSWLEFDGNMYMQQLSTDGVEQLARMGEKTGASIYGICLNHWRTAENRTAIAYAARALIKPVETAVFYRNYASSLGIPDADGLTEALRRLARLDTFNRDNMFNIGFCYLGCWLAPRGLKWIRNWDVKFIAESLKEYERIRSLAEACLQGVTKREGIAYLRFLLNQIRCSILHQQAILELKVICTFADDQHPERLSDEQRGQVLAQCAKADEYAREYMAAYRELLPDRGCEGTLVSYYATIPVYIDHIRAYFSLGETKCSHKPATWDAPPPPDIVAAVEQD